MLFVVVCRCLSYFVVVCLCLSLFVVVCRCLSLFVVVCRLFVCWLVDWVCCLLLFVVVGTGSDSRFGTTPNLFLLG